jgi:hypothetical protein
MPSSFLIKYFSYTMMISTGMIMLLVARHRRTLSIDGRDELATPLELFVPIKRVVISAIWDAERQRRGARSL